MATDRQQLELKLKLLKLQREKAAMLTTSAPQPKGQVNPNAPPDVPQIGPDGQIVFAGELPPPKERSFAEKAEGVGEAALATLTGMTTGAAGFLTGAAKGIGQELLTGNFGQGIAERSALEGAEAYTRAPRSAAGQEYTQNISETLAPLQAIGPMAQQFAVPRVAARPQRTITGSSQNMGAAQTPAAALRVERAQALPVPIRLIKGQATRDHMQQQFERETAKLDIGAPIRERYAEQNQAILRNFDAWVDQTGSQAPTLRDVGLSVDRAVNLEAKRAKKITNELYKKAEQSGEMQQPVSMEGVVNLLNESQTAESTAPVLVAARKELQRLGGAAEDTTNALLPSEKGLTLAKAEQLRKFVNKITGNDPTNIKFATDIKKAIDQATEGKGGALYKSARRARMKYAEKFENRAVVNNLMRTKRGTKDRAVAYEDVFKNTILNGSLDDISHLKRVLTGRKSNPEGRQAWMDLQGHTIEWIKGEATKNVQRDIRGNEIISAAGLDKAVKSLDKKGKLDYLFGKRGAEQLRDINELAKDVFTAPPGTVNTSNTASALKITLDVIGTNMLTGLPAPAIATLRAATKSMKNRKTAKRINEALNYGQ